MHPRKGWNFESRQRIFAYWIQIKLLVGYDILRKVNAAFLMRFDRSYLNFFSHLKFLSEALNAYQQINAPGASTETKVTALNSFSFFGRCDFFV